MKKIFTLLFTVIVFCALSVSSFGADYPRFIDDAELVSDAALSSALERKLDSYSEKLGFDFVIVTVNSIYGEDPEQYACDFYDNCGYGYGAEHDGVILLINMGERDWVITSTGYGQEALNRDAREYISDLFLDDLSAGEYYTAFNSFADNSAVLVERAKNGDPYKKPFNYFGAIVIALIIGAVIGFIRISSLKGKLKSVKKQYAASNYVVADSLNVTLSNERFLYFHVARTAKPTNNNSSHSSSGGSSHSSSSGKF